MIHVKMTEVEFLQSLLARAENSLEYVLTMSALTRVRERDELLAALKEILSEFDLWEGPGAAAERARALIARIEGGNG